MLEKTTCLTLMSILFLGLCGCGKTTDPAPVAPANAVASTEDTKPLFEQSCSKCHANSRAEQYSGKEPWKDIVARMIDKHGAKVSADDATRIVAHLDKTYPQK